MTKLQNINSRVIKLSDESEALCKVGCLKQCIEKLNECIQMLYSHNDAITRHRDKHPGRVLFDNKATIFCRIIQIEFGRCNYGNVIEIYNSMRERENFEKCFPWFRWDIDIYHELVLIKSSCAILGEFFYIDVPTYALVNCDCKIERSKLTHGQDNSTAGCKDSNHSNNISTLL